MLILLPVELLEQLAFIQRLSVPKLDVSLAARSSFFVRNLAASWLQRTAPALIPWDFPLRQFLVGMLDKTFP